MSGFFQSLILNLLLLSTSVQGLRKIICDKAPGQVNQLAAGEVVFFESQNFPATIPPGPSLELDCTASFSRQDNNNNGFFFAFTNGVSIQFSLNNYSTNYFWGDSVIYNTFDRYLQNTSVLDYNKTPPNSSYSDWNAFQGIVYAPAVDHADSPCWLQEKNFDLTDETQIIPLAAYDDSTTAGICNWHFTVPNGYKLKINTFLFKPFGGESLSVQNSDNQQKLNVQKPGIDTLEGSRFTVTYNKVAHGKAGGIYAYVSAVQQNPVQTTENCIKVDDSGVFVSVYNLDYQKGYKNNMICSSPISLNVNKTYLVQFYDNFVEHLGDNVYFKDSKNQFFMQNLNFPGSATNYIIDLQQPNQPITSINFESDGSVQGVGFKFTYREQPCACPTSFTPNCGVSYKLKSLTQLGSSYCSNMNCQIQFTPNPSCPTNKMTLKVTAYLRSGYTAFDNFTLIVNGKIGGQFLSPEKQVSMKRDYTFEATDTITAYFTSGTPDANTVVYGAPDFWFAFYSVPATSTTTTTKATPTTSTASRTDFNGFLGTFILLVFLRVFE